MYMCLFPRRQLSVSITVSIILYSVYPGNAPISTLADIYSFGICALEVSGYTQHTHTKTMLHGIIAKNRLKVMMSHHIGAKNRLKVMSCSTCISAKNRLRLCHMIFVIANTVLCIG